MVEDIIFELGELRKRLKEALSKVENNIFSKDIDYELENIEGILRRLAPLVSSLIEKVNSGHISYDMASRIMTLFSDVEQDFLKLIQKLEKISSDDAKRIEQIINVENQIRSSQAFAVKGKNIKTKT